MELTVTSRPKRRRRFTARRMDRGPLAFRILTSTPPAETTAPPVVLIHGIGMSHRYHSRLHDELAATRVVHSIDLPGFGGLPKPGIDVDVAGMARGLAGVLDTLHSTPVVLVGHSMGAQWVAEVALTRPDLVAHLVMMGPVVDAEHRTLPAQLGALALDTLGETPLINAIVFSDYVRCGVPWYLAQARHMLSYPIDERVPLLTMPLLILRGAHDPISGLEWCRRLRDAAPTSRLIQIPGRHHVAQHSSPKATASAILAGTAV